MGYLVKIFRRSVAVVMLCCIAHSSFGADSSVVTFNPTVQRYLGDVGELDRVKFFKLHSGYTTTDADVLPFLTLYDATLGRGFWGPFSWAYNNTGSANTYREPAANSNTSVRAVNGIVTSERPDATVINWETNVEDAGVWAAEYFNNYAGSLIAEYFEPISEPFVAASESKFGAPSAAQMREKMADFFAEAGKNIRNTPQLSNLKVVGYGSAYPTYEQNDFSIWEDRMKMFIDRAGQYMDAFSIHLYDGLNAAAGQHTRRSGSNSEAIMDLIETYSYIKLGVVKPFAITEYGGIYNNNDSNGVAVYVEEEQSQLVGCVNHLLFGFLEREDNMMVSIPFITGKSTDRLSEAYNYQPYCATLFLPTDRYNPDTTSWYYSTKIRFYEFWLGVSGTRVDIFSNNPDIQTLALRNGDKLYLALDNLDDSAQSVTLTAQESGSDCTYSSIRKRSLESTTDGRGIIYSETSLSSMPSELTLEPNEAVLLIADIASTPMSQLKSVLRRKKYYDTNYLHQISGSTITSRFQGVISGSGRANLRMSICRSLTASKQPEISVNGHSVEVPDNWAGYDQSDRTEFFGMVEIDVPIEYIKTGENVVETKFPDSGGRLSTMILEVETYDSVPIYVASDLEDGGFEDGDLSCWLPLTKGGVVSLSSDSSAGVWAAQISGEAALSQNILLESSTEYTLKFKSKGSAVRLYVNDQSVGTSSSAVSYTESEMSFTTKSSGVTRITLASESESGDVLIDECSIEIK